MLAVPFRKWKPLLTDSVVDGSAGEGSDRGARVEGGVFVRFQQVFDLLNGQDKNKIFDVCSLLKLVRFGAQNLFDFGYRTRELFSEILYDAVPLHWLVRSDALSSSRFGIGSSTGRLMPWRKDHTFEIAPSN